MGQWAIVSFIYGKWKSKKRRFFVYTSTKTRNEDGLIYFTVG